MTKKLMYPGQNYKIEERLQSCEANNDEGGDKIQLHLSNS